MEAEVVHSFGKHNWKDFLLMMAHYPVVLSFIEGLDDVAWLMLTAIHE